MFCLLPRKEQLCFKCSTNTNGYKLCAVIPGPSNSARHSGLGPWTPTVWSGPQRKEPLLHCPGHAQFELSPPWRVLYPLCPMDCCYLGSLWAGLLVDLATGSTLVRVEGRRGVGRFCSAPVCAPVASTLVPPTPLKIVSLPQSSSSGSSTLGSVSSRNPDFPTDRKGKL